MASPAKSYRMISLDSDWLEQCGLITGIALVGLLLRLAPLLRSDLSFAFVHDDSFWFTQTAAGILHGCGFARWIGGVCAPPEIMRTPGYPLMLALMPNIRWALAAQDLLGCAVCLLVAFWVWRRWGIGAACIAEFLIAFDLPSIVFGDFVMSEQLFQFLLVIAMVPPLLAVSARFSGSKAMAVTAFSAIAAGVAMLVRPIGILIPLLTPIPFLFSTAIPGRRRLALALLASMVPAVVAIGWSVRNYAKAGYFGVSIEGPINLYFFRATEVVARENGTALLSAQDLMGQRLGVGIDRIYDRDVQSSELAERMDRIAENVLVSHPLEALAMTLEGTVYMALFPLRSSVATLIGSSGGSAGWGLMSGAPSTERFQSELQKMLHSPALTALVGFEMLTGLAMWAGVVWALVQCLRASPDYRTWVLSLTVVSMVMMAVGAGGEAEVRLRVPVVPLLAIVAALGYMPVLGQLAPLRFRRSVHLDDNVSRTHY